MSTCHSCSKCKIPSLIIKCMPNSNDSPGPAGPEGPRGLSGPEGPMGPTGPPGTFLTERIAIGNIASENILSTISGCTGNGIGVVEWMTHIGGNSFENSPTISINDLGEIIISGNYDSNQITSYNKDGSTGPGVPIQNAPDIFISKYDSCGWAQWMAHVGSNGAQLFSGIDINERGNIAIVGDYTISEIVAYNSDGTTGPTAPLQGSQNVFLANYNSDGIAEWITHIGGNLNVTRPSVSINNKNKIVVAGIYNNNPVVTYNSDGTTGPTAPLHGNSNVFIAKYDFCGYAEWIAHIGGNVVANDTPNISVNNIGEIVVVGVYDGDITAYNSDGTAGPTISSEGNYDIFIVKYDTKGRVKWIAHIGENSKENTPSVSINDLGNIVVSGRYMSNVAVAYNSDGTTGPTVPLQGTSSIFVAKYNSCGHTKWMTHIGGNSNEALSKISLNDKDEIMVSGQYFSNPVVAYNSDGTTGPTVPLQGNSNIFICKYDLYGYAKWMAHVGGTSSDTSSSISINNEGEIVAAGTYNSNPLVAYDSDGMPGLNVLKQGFSDIFVVKYDSCPIYLEDGTVDGFTKVISNDGENVITVLGNFGSICSLTIYPKEIIRLTWSGILYQWLYIK